MSNKKAISQLCGELRKTQTELKSLKEEAREKLSELEDTPREHRHQMTEAVYLTNAEHYVCGALEYLKELC